MAASVPSKCWSTGTLEAGIQHVSHEADLAMLEAEELRIQRELEETIVPKKIYLFFFTFLPNIHLILQ